MTEPLQPNYLGTPPSEPKVNWFKKHQHLMLGILFVVLAFAAIVCGIYYWQTSNFVQMGSFVPINQSKVEILAGADVDNNGIRDDIDQYITEKYPNDLRTQGALKQLAQTEQAYVIANGTESIASNLNKDLISANDCLEYISGATKGASQAMDLKLKILNSSQRIVAYGKSDAVAGRGSYLLTPEDDLKKGCKFDPDKLSKSSSMTDFSTWKTYTNSQYGFSFKYPYAWDLQEKSVNSDSNNYYRVTLTHSTGNFILIEVNKDSSLLLPKSQFNKYYDIALNSKKIAIKSYEAPKTSNVTNPQGAELISGRTSQVKDSNNNTYYWRFSYGAESDLESTFKDIIESTTLTYD